MNKGTMNMVIKAIDDATPTLRKIGKGFGSLKKAGSALGSGLKMAAGGALAITGAVAAFAIAATSAAADEEKQIARLNGVLKTRGMLTDANSAAVEKQIGKLENLAFADDAVRESLIVATQFTKNFNDALKIQNVAADVAAAKGISLEEATALVGKAYQGNTKGLKGLGVEVKKGAKGVDILTAVTKKYKGAAEAAANTTSGKFTKAQLKFNNIIEDFGAKLLPYANKALDFISETALPALSSALNTALPIIEKVGKGLADTFGPMIQDNINNMTKPGGVFDSVGKVVGPIFGRISDSVGGLIAKLTGPGGLLTALGDVIGTLWGDGKGPLATAVGAIGNIMSLLIDTIANIAGAIAGLITAVDDFLKAFGKASDVSKGGSYDYYRRMGGITTPTAPGTQINQYGVPVITVKIGEKSVDSIVTDSLGRIIDTSNLNRQ
jgi:RecA/RadA recombinase